MTAVERGPLVKWWALALAVVALALAAYATVTAVNQGRQITGLRAQLTRDSAALAQDGARLAGDRRDVITCGDLHNLGLSVVDNFATVQADGSVFVNQQPIQLPGHCLNP
jgi:hypothetical protein